MPKNFIDPELGEMRVCCICREAWPADREFFYPGGQGRGFHTRCKACYSEWRTARRKKQKEEALV